MAPADHPPLDVAPHPLLDLAVLVCTFARPLAELATPDAVLEHLAGRGASWAPADDVARRAVRDLLRHGGFKPTGRSKPSSEYLAAAAPDGRLGAINAAVDCANAASLASALPISVVDLDRLAGPTRRVALTGAGERYPFNASGQEIDVAGLLCLIDEEGPCANAVKDAQRTKTHAETRRTLSLIWGTTALAGRARATRDAYAELLRGLGADVTVAP